MENTSFLKRTPEHLAEVIALLSMGLVIIGTMLGIEWILLVGVIGFIVGTPLVLFLGPDYETMAERNGDDIDNPSQEDPLETLKAQYAEGTLSEDEFERKVDCLLEVDSAEAIDPRTREPSMIEETDRDTGTADLEEEQLHR
ncbi:SHOCT domain-containing protein [Natrinema soli]|uniref:SHOCT domain-containing protein n=1 Tax=Natrinema soli TaxID=1930624 RepID=A0ABD5T0R3_9EURY|nr:SHOCT domain-containing protein [Natrinema soli]